MRCLFGVGGALVLLCDRVKVPVHAPGHGGRASVSSLVVNVLSASNKGWVGQAATELPPCVTPVPSKQTMCLLPCPATDHHHPLLHQSLAANVFQQETPVYPARLPGTPKQQVGADAPPGFRRGWYSSAARVSRAALQGLRAVLRNTPIEKTSIGPSSWNSCCFQLVVCILSVRVRLLARRRRCCCCSGLWLVLLPLLPLLPVVGCVERSAASTRLL